MKKKLLILSVTLSINFYAQNTKIEWYKDKLDTNVEILGVVNQQTIGIINENNSISYIKISNNGEISKKVKLPFKFDNIKFTYLNTIISNNSVIVLIKENMEKELLKIEQEKIKKENEDKKKEKEKRLDDITRLNVLKNKYGSKNKEALKKIFDSIREAKIAIIEKNKIEKIKRETELILAINIGTELNVDKKPFKIKGITIKDRIKKFGNYSFSNDSTKILIYNQYHTGNNDQLKFSFSIVDQGITNVEQDTIFEIPMLMVSPEKTKFSKLYLDNNNNIMGIFRQIRSIENNNSNFFYKTLIFDKEIFKPRAFDIDYDGDIIDNLEVFPQENNKYLFVGFLAGIKKGVKFSGKASVKKNEVFVAEVNTEQKTYTKIFNTNIDALYPYNNLKIINYMPYKAENIYINNKNEYVIITHQINKKTKTNIITPGEDIDYDNKNFFYGDVSIIKVNKKGVLNYSASISKYQSPSNVNPMMLYTYRNNILYAIYEDNIINKEVDFEIDPWTTIRNNETKNLDKSLFISSIEENKNLLKEMIYDYKKISNRVIIKQSVKLNNNTFLLIGNNGLGKLTIN
jgi:hypothetical protein